VAPIPDTKKNQISFIMRVKYPVLEAIVSGKNSPGLRDQSQIPTLTHEEMSDFKANLEKLDDHEIERQFNAAMLLDMQRKADEANRIEAERFYNLSYCDADFNHWVQMSYWTTDEMTSLSLGKNPKLVNWDNVKSLIRLSTFALQYHDRREVILRAITMGQLWNQTIPTNFVDWAGRMKVQLPVALTEKVSELGTQVADWKALHDLKNNFANDLLEKRQDAQNARMEDAKNHRASQTELMQSQKDMAAKYNEIIEGYKSTLEQQSKKISELQNHIDTIPFAPAKSNQ